MNLLISNWLWDIFILVYGPALILGSLATVCRIYFRHKGFRRSFCILSGALILVTSELLGVCNCGSANSHSTLSFGMAVSGALLAWYSWTKPWLIIPLLMLAIVVSSELANYVAFGLH